MDISRRAFIQTTIAGGAAVTAFGFDVAPVYAQAKTLKIARTSETRSTCPYCSVGCVDPQRAGSLKTHRPKRSRLFQPNNC